MHTFSLPRSLGAFFALFLSALLLSSWRDTFTRHLYTRQPLNEPDSPLDYLSARSVARRFGRYNYPNSSSENPAGVIHKRGVLSYRIAKCKGTGLYEQIQDAFRGKVSLGSVYTFSAQSIDNGWRVHDDVNALGSEWDNVFRKTNGRVPTEAEVMKIGLSQSDPYKNTRGEEISVRSPQHSISQESLAANIPQKGDERSGGHYEADYIPSFSTIIATDTRSPRSRLLERTQGRITETEINRRVPPLSRFSDVIWTVWNWACKEASKDPNSLRYIGRDRIANSDTTAIVKEVFARKGAVVDWPGYTYGVDSDEGQALLGTPHGVGVAWLLIDRVEKLGKRVPKVTIWSPSSGSFRILWDLQPVTPAHTINKRARTLTYETAVCNGKKLYDTILDAYEGKHEPNNPLRQLSKDDLDNGWTIDPVPTSLPGNWENAFRNFGKELKIGERKPEQSELRLIDLVQDKAFRNVDGAQTDAIPKNARGKRAHYEVIYVPLFNALICTDNRSPKFQVKQNHDFQISDAEVNKLIPPLNRMSDVLWTVWGTVTQTPNNLRYICRDAIYNDDTRGIMNDIFDKGPTGKPTPWPGLTFSIDKDEALALLATPNGLATAYLLIDRAKELGRRVPSVTIFAPYPDRRDVGYAMLWDLRPA